ncbi:hypothetical protein ACM66B_004575 [Microbotryomycetes sp. NB124-2]
MFSKRRAQPGQSTTAPTAVKVVKVHKVGNTVTSVSTLPAPVVKPVPKPQPQVQTRPAFATSSSSQPSTTGALNDASKASNGVKSAVRSLSAPTNSSVSRDKLNSDKNKFTTATKSTSKTLSGPSTTSVKNGKHRSDDSDSSDEAGTRLNGKDDRQSKKRKLKDDSSSKKATKVAPALSRTASADQKRSASPKKVVGSGNESPKPAARKTTPKLTAQATKTTTTEPVKNGAKSAMVSQDEDAGGGYQSESSEDGTPGFAPRKREPSPVVERDVLATEDGSVPHMSGAQLVAGNRKAYKEYFVDLADPAKSASEWSGEDVPTVTLEYPGLNGSERFILLVPKDADEYNPITDVVTTIRLVIDNFLTASQAHSLLDHTQGPSSFSAFLSAQGSRSATPGTPNELASPASTPLPPLMRSLEKARAKRDGPAFLAEVERYNDAIRQLKADNKIVDNIRDMKGLRQQVWEKIAAQTYERAVGPEIEELRNYPAFSDNVYGELLPKFMAEIFQKTGLDSNSVFVDLGSGVGNCVVQAALATGCEAWGFENMKHASALARKQAVEAESRFRMWGVKAGSMHVVEADFCEHPQVGEVLKRADVILVNNEVFTSSLNERLSLLFLDLRSDTKIVSLKAFASSFTLSAHNRHSPLAIIRQGPALRYPRNSVSWKSEPGTYFIGHIDRSMLAKFDEQEQQRAGR